MGTVSLEQSRQMVKWLAQKAHLEALFKNREIYDKWERYKKDHEELLPRFSEFCKHLKVNVMVPVGKKALMPGTLVHTNEILISLGDGWFIKQSAENAAEVCKRRIIKCEEFLDKLNKERNLLESRISFSSTHYSAFPDEDLKEIIEPLDEEREKEWREKHQKSLSRSHAEEMAQRKGDVDKDSEETNAIWRRLEELEMQEELAGELDRVGVTEEEDYESSDLDSDDLSVETVEEETVEEETPVVAETITEAVKDTIVVHTTLVENKSPEPVFEDTAKKISKFKAARMKK